MVSSGHTANAHLAAALNAHAPIVQDSRGKLHVDRLAAAAHHRKPHQDVPVLPRPFHQRQAVVQVVLVVLAVGMSAKVSEVLRITDATRCFTYQLGGHAREQLAAKPELRVAVAALGVFAVPLEDKLGVQRRAKPRLRFIVHALQRRQVVDTFRSFLHHCVEVELGRRRVPPLVRVGRRRRGSRRAYK